MLQYLEQPSLNNLSTLSDDAIIQIAYYLPLQSVSLLSSANKYLDIALSSDFLYFNCDDNDLQLVGEQTTVLLHPSLCDLMGLLPADYERPKGVARNFSLEAKAFRLIGMGEHVFYLVDIVYTVLYNKGIKDMNILAFTTESSTGVTTRTVFTGATFSYCPPGSEH